MKGTLLLSVWDWLPSSLFAWFVLFIVFGPLFACVLCAGQLARSRQEDTLVGLTNSQVHRLTRAVLLFAAVSSCSLILSVGIALGLRGPTWSEVDPLSQYIDPLGQQGRALAGPAPSDLCFSYLPRPGPIGMIP